MVWSCYRLSGIDEQCQAFECPVCDKLEYWVIKASNGIDGDGIYICLGFLNNLKAPRQIIDNPPVFQIVSSLGNISLQRFLVLVDRVICANCRHSLVLDSPIWNQILSEIKKGWGRRGFV